AEQVPQGDVDAAYGVLDGAAAALPERGLAQLLADSGRLVAALADQVRSQQLDGGGHQRAAGHAAAAAGGAPVRVGLADRVEVLLRLVALRPAAIDGAADQPDDAHVADLHRVAPEEDLNHRDTEAQRRQVRSGKQGAGMPYFPPS